MALARQYGADWRAWPPEYRTPGDPAVHSFAGEHAAEVRYHQWLQWPLDGQLARAAAVLPIVQDLPVGLDPGGADAGVRQDLLAQVAIRQAVRAEIRLELKSFANRLAMLGAKASIAAGTAENMMVTLFERSIAGDTSEKQRQAKAIHDEARKKAVSGLKQPVGDEDV